MANETTNIEWYFAEDNNKDLRQVVLCIPQGLQKESRFGTLMLSAKYRNLIESEHGTGFFRMDSDAGPFLLTRLDGYTDKLVEGSIKIAFSFFRTEYGGLVGIYIGMESRSLCEAFDKPYPFLEMINGLDERDTTVKLYDDAFSKETLVVSIADRSMSTTSFYDENSGSFSEANSPQCVYDIDIDLPQECREVLQKELADVLSYHDNMSGYSRDFQQSVQCVYGVMPMGENPILPKVQEAVQEKVAEKIIGQQDPEGQGESTDIDGHETANGGSQPKPEYCQRSGSVTAKEYGNKTGASEEEVIQQIRDGKLVGHVKNGFWFVDVDLMEKGNTSSVGGGKPGMVGGAKFGLFMVCVWVILFATNLILANMYSDIWEDVGGILAGAWGLSIILIGLSGLATGIQKGRPIVGIISLLLMPIGFFIALAVKNKQE